MTDCRNTDAHGEYREAARRWRSVHGFRIAVPFAVLVTTTSARANCPSRTTLDVIAQQAWRAPAVRPKCLAIHASERLTLVVDVATLDLKPPPKNFDPYMNGGQGYAAIVDEAGMITWQDAWNDETPGDMKQWTLVDLDGDGNDELVEEQLHIGHMGSSRSSLRVFAIGSDGVPSLGGELRLHDSFPKDKNACTSTHRLVVHSGRPVTIEITGTRETNPQFSTVDEALCPSKGRHRYRWDGMQLIETR
jgi:hypothetical protein